MIYRLMYRGAAYADSLQYHHCIGGSYDIRNKDVKNIKTQNDGKIFTSALLDLWKYALELRIAKDTILYCDTCFTAQVKRHQ